MCILIIDASIESEPKVKETFSDYGLQNSVISKTAEDALQYINGLDQGDGAEPLTLIIIDQDLPDKNSYELCQEIRKIPACKQTYIMIIDDMKNHDKAIQAGANDHSIKPYEKGAFLKHLINYSYKKMAFLVEDNPTEAKIVTTILYKYNVEVVAKTDGISAYNLINTMLPPKLAFLDIGIPQKNGLELLSQIRSKDMWNITDIIMVTAHHEVEFVKKAIAHGANDYISKPFELEDFAARIHKYFS